eukprot:398920_1
MTLFLLISVIIWYISYCERIICNNPGECAGSQYSCNTGADDCIIICSANNACGSSIFNCNQAHKCNITCSTTDGSACEKTHFHAYDTSSLLFTGQNNQFLDGHLTCHSHSECNLRCGVMNNPLGNDGMCKNTVIDASQANKLKITALGQETLRYSQIYCPQRGNCIIDLIGTNTGNYKISNTAIFIDDPRYVNLKITCDDIANPTCYGDDANAPILYCFNKTYQCVYLTRNGRDWFCQGGGPCSYNFTFVPTNTPTIEPTKAPHNAQPANSKNGGVIAVIIFLILFCCIVSMFFGWKWYNKRKSGAYGSYEGLLGNNS